MAINAALVGLSLGTERRRWGSDSAILYALGVGAGEVPGELAFTTENSIGVPQQVLPGYAAVLGFPAAALLAGREGDAARLGAADLFAGHPPLAILHAGHRLTVHGPLPVAGDGELSAVVSAVHDTGTHALVAIDTKLHDAGTGRALAANRATFLVRGAGGFGGPGPVRHTWPVPNRAPDGVFEFATSPTQGLLFRLSGDRNRLHSDPAAAQEAGFPRPILHGLCSHGIAARALVQTICGGDAAAFGSMDARFTSPVLPGETLSVRIWDDAGGAQFQVTADGRTVMDHGTFTHFGNMNRGVNND